jgi:hypothetical protein
MVSMTCLEAAVVLLLQVGRLLFNRKVRNVTCKAPSRAPPRQRLHQLHPQAVDLTTFSVAVDLQQLQVGLQNVKLSHARHISLTLSYILPTPSSAPFLSAPAPPAPAGPPAPYGGELTQGNVPVDNMFGGPPQGQAPPSSLAPGGDAGFGGLFDSAPAAAPLQIANDPWGGPTAYDNSTALVPSNAVDDDPFGIFGAGGPPPPGPAPVENAAPSNGGYAERSGPGSVVAPTPTEVPEQQKSAPITRGEGGLPSGGEFYDAKIFTPTLGVMFFKPQELTDSLFLQTDRDLVNALDDRPVVAFIVEGSSARSAGVELGHVLLKVNGIDVKNPKEASRLIKEGPRPLPLLFYVPDTTVVVAEGEHMVKYDTRETGAPPSSKDWKPKYVVVGGIIAQSWMLNMYRSKVSCQIEQNLDFFL